jgi:hypothetical protein
VGVPLYLDTGFVRVVFGFVRTTWPEDEGNQDAPVGDQQTNYKHYTKLPEFTHGGYSKGVETAMKHTL